MEEMYTAVSTRHNADAEMGCTAYHESRHVRTSYVVCCLQHAFKHIIEEIAQLCALKHVEVTVRQLIMAQIHAFVTLTAFCNYPSIIALLFRTRMSAVPTSAQWD
jgi:hypothetical protein